MKKRAPFHQTTALLAAFFSACSYSSDSVSFDYVPGPYNIQMHAILMSDDDGARAVKITPEEIKKWVDVTNTYFSNAAIPITLKFDAAKDVESMKNTLLNNVWEPLENYRAAGLCESDSNCEHYRNSAIELGNKLANEHLGEMLVVFRHGVELDEDGKYNPDIITGNGFSNLSLGFIGMPGDFWGTWVKTDIDRKNNPKKVLLNGDRFVGDDSWFYVQNYAQLAHDIGHYLGLNHTFPKDNDLGTDTQKELQELFSSTSTPTESLLDGDFIGDTPPEAGTGFYFSNGWETCAGPESYTVKVSKKTEFKFTPDKLNVMSYFLCGEMHFSEGQKNRMLYFLNHPWHRRHLIEENTAKIQTPEVRAFDAAKSAESIED